MASTAQAMDAPIERLVRRVVEAMNPLEVWLFGSRAENRATPTSDYDLLVVMPDGTPEAELDPVRAWRLGWDVRVTADIIPCTRNEFGVVGPQVARRRIVAVGIEISARLLDDEYPLAQRDDRVQLGGC